MILFIDLMFVCIVVIDEFAARLRYDYQNNAAITIPRQYVRKSYPSKRALESAQAIALKICANFLRVFFAL